MDNRCILLEETRDLIGRIPSWREEEQKNTMVTCVYATYGAQGLTFQISSAYC